MNEVTVGGRLTEFPGRTFNEMQQRIRRLEANQLPRRSGGGRGGGGDSLATGTANGVIPAQSSGIVSVVRGSPISLNWWNDSGKDIPSGYICIAGEIDGLMIIISAFCPPA